MRSAALATLLLSPLCLATCGHDDGERTILLSGPTMGTQFNITLVDPPTGLDREMLRTNIVKAFAQINQLMSTYLSDSELSRFNQQQTTDWFDISEDTHDVVSAAQKISAMTDGAFDATIGPIVNLWGFGPDGRTRLIPSDDDIDKARARTGYHNLEVRAAPPALRKRRGDLYVDLSAIAKGYAVDRIAGLLDGRGIDNYLVEVGGELRTRGHNAKDASWTIAVERPLAGERSVHTLIRVSGQAVATSGSYRNFFELDEVRYSHTIDPRTGRPITNTLASVTVVHASAMMADAIATALTVLGPQKGFALARRENLAVLFILREGEGFVERGTRSYYELEESR